MMTITNREMMIIIFIDFIDEAEERWRIIFIDEAEERYAPKRRRVRSSVRSSVP